MSKELADSSGRAATAGDGLRVATRTKFYFGVGAGGEAASNWIFHALGMIFYQQVLGLPAGLAGLAFFFGDIGRRNNRSPYRRDFRSF